VRCGDPLGGLHYGAEPRRSLVKFQQRYVNSHRVFRNFLFLKNFWAHYTKRTHGCLCTRVIPKALAPANHWSALTASYGSSSPAWSARPYCFRRAWPITSVDASKDAKMKSISISTWSRAAAVFPAGISSKVNLPAARLARMAQQAELEYAALVRSYRSFHPVSPQVLPERGSPRSAASTGSLSTAIRMDIENGNKIHTESSNYW
jgi:hypothetical protein